MRIMEQLLRFFSLKKTTSDWKSWMKLENLRKKNAAHVSLDQHGAQETHTLKAPSARNVPSEASAHSETIGAKITDQLCLPYDLVSTA